MPATQPLHDETRTTRITLNLPRLRQLRVGPTLALVGDLDGAEAHTSLRVTPEALAAFLDRHTVRLVPRPVHTTPHTGRRRQ